MTDDELILLFGIAGKAMITGVSQLSPGIQKRTANLQKQGGLIRSVIDPNSATLIGYIEMPDGEALELFRLCLHDKQPTEEYIH